MKNSTSPLFGAKVFARVRAQNEQERLRKRDKSSTPSFDQYALGPARDAKTGTRTFGWEHFAGTEPTQMAEQFWATLPPAILDQLNALLPGGSTALGRQRKGQRYWVGMRKSAGLLLGWRSSSNLKNRSKIAILWCGRCLRVWECRIDHFLGTVKPKKKDKSCNLSCGCGADDNRCDLLEAALLVNDSDQDCIAQELELGASTFWDIARHFQLKNRLFPWMKSGFTKYVMHHIWKRWTDALWRRLGDGLICRIGRRVACIGLRRAAKQFGLTIAEAKAIGRRCKQLARRSSMKICERYVRRIFPQPSNRATASFPWHQWTEFCGGCPSNFESMRIPLPDYSLWASHLYPVWRGEVRSCFSDTRLGVVQPLYRLQLRIVASFSAGGMAQEAGGLLVARANVSSCTCEQAFHVAASSLCKRCTYTSQEHPQSATPRAIIQFP